MNPEGAPGPRWSPASRLLVRVTRHVFVPDRLPLLLLRPGPLSRRPLCLFYSGFFGGPGRRDLGGRRTAAERNLVAPTLGERDLDYALKHARCEDLLWDRSCIDLPHALGVTIVYGHTPNLDFQVRWNSPFGIGIDTGAVYGGRLTAIRLPDETVFQA